MSMADKRGPGLKAKQIPWPIIFIILLLSAGIFAVSFFQYRRERESILKEQTSQLQATASLKSAQIQNWLAERLGDANTISRNPLMADELSAFLDLPPSKARADDVRFWLQGLVTHYKYDNALLLDGKLAVVAAATPRDAVIGPEARVILERVRRARIPEISDLHRNESVPHLHLDVITPVLVRDHAIGFVILRIDPARFLFPMIQSWPTPSPSAETLLVRREGDSALFLNELRHRKGTAMKLRLPLASETLPAALAVKGHRGVVVGRDYRGIPVWSVVAAIPGTAWFIIAKVDEKEILAPLRREAGAAWMITLSLIAAAGALLLFLWQRQARRLTEKRLAAEIQQQAMERHYGYLTRYANDIIILSDEERRIVEINERAEQAYGRSRDELLAMTIPDLRAEAERDKIEGQYDPSRMSDGAVFETVHVRRDGSTFPVEVSARMIEVEGRRFFQSIVRDISERRAAQNALQESEDYIRTVLNNLPIGVAVNSVDPDVTFSYMNDNFPRIYRTTREELAGPDAFWQAVYPDEGFRKEIRNKVLADCASGDAERMAWSDIPLSRLGEETSYVDARNVPIPDKGMMISLVWDVTARKRGEESLRQANERMRRFIEADIVGVVIATPGGGIVEANDYYLNLIGFTRSEFEQGRINWREITPPEWLPADERALRELERTGKCAPYEKEYARRDGSRVPVLLIDAMLPGPEKQIAAFALDLTERKRAEEERKTTQEFLENIIEMSPFAMWISDAGGTVIRVNRSLCDAIRLAAEQIVGKYNVLRDANLEKQGVMPQVRDVFAKLEPTRFSIPWQAAAAGEEHFRKARDMYIDVSMFPIRDAGGKLTHVVCQWIDISELKRAQAEQQRLLHILESSLNEVYVFDAGSLKFEYVNPGALRNLGYPLETLLAMSPVAIKPEYEEASFRAAIAPLLDGQQERLEFETVHRRRDGSTYPVEVHLQLVEVEGRRLFLAVILDISERRRAEAALRESEEKFRQVFEASNTGKSLTLPGGEVVPNLALCDMLGYSPGELQKLRWQDITPADDIPATERILKPMLDGKQDAARFVKRYVRKDGSIIWGDVSVSLRRDAAGKPLHFITTVVDISERVRAESEIMRINQELEERVRQRTVQLEATNRELEAFSYSVSHDLRAPLRAIAGFGKILEEENSSRLDGEGRRILGVIIENTGKMGQLIDDLLAFSRLSRQGLALAEVDLIALAQDAFTELKPQESERRIEFKAGTLPRAFGDRAMLSLVLQNLLANAIKFTRPRRIARIELGGNSQGAESVYFVRDNGVGFEMEYADKLFGVFQRLHQSGEFEGTGVGLAIVQRIVARHGGRVWAEGRPGKGATFYFALPAPATAGAHGNERGG
jgi:PAS domain S-box-containing protein